MTADVVRLWPRLSMRTMHEFTCAGCGERIIAAVHYGHRDFCFMCQELGPEMSRIVRDLSAGKSAP